MMVPFCTICDRCQVRSEEYTAWPSCRECLEDICQDCAASGTLIETDGESPETVLCTRCAHELEQPDDLTGYDYTGGGR